MENDLITTGEAARLTGYTARYISALCRQGRIEARKFGDTWQVGRASVLAWQRRMAELGTMKHARGKGCG